MQVDVPSDPQLLDVGVTDVGILDRFEPQSAAELVETRSGATCLVEVAEDERDRAQQDGDERGDPGARAHVPHPR